MLLESSPPTQQTPSTIQPRTVRPYGVYALHGLASKGHHLIAVDSVRGYLLQIDCANDNTIVLNPLNVQQFHDAQGLAVWEDQVWFSQDHRVYWCTLQDFTPRPFVALPYPVNGVAVWQTTVYIACQKAGYILVYDAKTGKRITQFSAPGVGEENLCVRDEELWVCDRTEQTVYCMDRATGAINYSILTPFDSPSGLAFHAAATGGDCLYVAYAGEEAYIRDDPNNLDNPLQLTFCDRRVCERSSRGRGIERRSEG